MKNKSKDSTNNNSGVNSGTLTKEEYERRLQLLEKTNRERMYGEDELFKRKFFKGPYPFSRDI